MLLLKFFHVTLKSESCEQQVHAKSKDPCFVKKHETAISVQLLVATFFRELIGEQNCMVTLCSTMPCPTRQTAQWLPSKTYYANGCLLSCRTTDFNICIYYLCGTLKGEVYVNNPHTLQQLKIIFKDKLLIFWKKGPVMS